MEKQYACQNDVLKIEKQKKNRRVRKQALHVISEEMYCKHTIYAL